jgi:hypothetical protein
VAVQQQRAERRDLHGRVAVHGRAQGELGLERADVLCRTAAEQHAEDDAGQRDAGERAGFQVPPQAPPRPVVPQLLGDRGTMLACRGHQDRATAYPS